MWNVLIDSLPNEWKGYPIDADFRTGIMISQCLADDELSEFERFYTAVDLLFPGEKPENNDAAEALKWFMNEYHHDNPSDEKSDVQVMDFDIDQWRIYSAFLNQYRIDLATAQMHWFVFMGLMSNLNECAFTGVMQIRQKKITAKMSAEEKKSIKQAKKIFAIKPYKEERLSIKEQQAVDEFLKYANIERKEEKNG